MDKSNLDGAARIALERLRQIEEEGRSISNDLHYRPGTLAMAGLCYTLMAASSPNMRRDLRVGVPFTGHWPWPEAAWKPSAGDDFDDRIRELEKAGALISAEIDYLLGHQRVRAVLR